MKKIMAILLCVMLLVTFAACNNGGTKSETASGSNESGTTSTAADVPADRYDGSNRTGNNATMPLVISTQTMDGKFNSFYATSAYDVDAVSNTQITLITTNELAEPVAGIDRNTYALSYKMDVSEDQSTTTYTFILKNGIKFSDGTLMTGKDLLFSIYEYLDPAYSGSATLYSMAIKGLTAYRTQVADENAAEEKQNEFAAQAQTRVDAVKAGTGTEADVAAAWECVKNAIASDNSVLISYGYTPADFGLAQPEDYKPYANTIILSYMGLVAYSQEDGKWVSAENANVDVSKMDSYTANDCIDLALAFCKATMTQAEYDEAFGYTTVTGDESDLKNVLKSEIADAYLEANKGTVKSVSGIVLDKVVGDDGVERERLSVTIDGVDPKAIWNFSIEVCPMHYYSTEALAAAADGVENFGIEFNSKDFQERLKQIVVPMGAGPYMACDSEGKVTTEKDKFFSNGILNFVANDNFCLGAPYIKYMRYKTITADSQIQSLQAHEVHYTDPSATSENINILTQNNLNYVMVDNLGYGYIGINAQLVPDINARRAIASAMDTKLTLEYYTGGLADVIYRGMSQVSWAYPQGATNMYPFDETGATSKEFFLKSDKFKEVDGKVVNADGTPLTYTFTLPSDATTHPSGAVFIKAKEVLEKIGVEVTIEVDGDLLNKLDSSVIAVWVAAWQATIDPDMYQVYYSDPDKNTASSPKSFGLYYMFQNGTDEEKTILERLNTLIIQGRTSLSIDERKPIYSEALDKVMELCVEIPTYQRKNMYAYDGTVIDKESLWQTVTPYKGPMSEIWNVKLLG